jgi:hypothetical protein
MGVSDNMQRPFFFSTSLANSIFVRLYKNGIAAYSSVIDIKSLTKIFELILPGTTLLLK